MNRIGFPAALFATSFFSIASAAGRSRPTMARRSTASGRGRALSATEKRPHASGTSPQQINGEIVLPRMSY